MARCTTCATVWQIMAQERRVRLEIPSPWFQLNMRAMGSSHLAAHVGGGVWKSTTGTGPHGSLVSSACPETMIVVLAAETA